MGEQTMKDLRELIKHKETEPRYTLGDSQVEYILSLFRQAVEGNLDKIKERIKFIKRPTGAKWIIRNYENKGYNKALRDVLFIIKDERKRLDEMMKV